MTQTRKQTSCLKNNIRKKTAITKEKKLFYQLPKIPTQTHNRWPILFLSSFFSELLGRQYAKIVHYKSRIFSVSQKRPLNNTSIIWRSFKWHMEPFTAPVIELLLAKIYILLQWHLFYGEFTVILDRGFSAHLKISNYLFPFFLSRCNQFQNARK